MLRRWVISGETKPRGDRPTKVYLDSGLDTVVVVVTGVTDLLMVVLGGQQLLVAVSLYGDDLGSQLLYLGAQSGPSVFLLDV